MPKPMLASNPKALEFLHALGIDSQAVHSVTIRFRSGEPVRIATLGWVDADKVKPPEWQHYVLVRADEAGILPCVPQDPEG